MVKLRLNLKKIIFLFVILFCVNFLNAQNYNLKSINGDSTLQKLELLEFVSIYMLDSVDDGVSENRIAVFNKRLNKWGYVDTLGKLVIPFIYTQASDFDNGFAFVSSSNPFHRVWKVITVSGVEIKLPDDYKYVGMFQNKLFVFSDNLLIYNTDGHLILDEIDEHIKTYKKYVLKNRDQYRFWRHPLLLED